MKLIQEIVIDKPIEEVWEILAIKFDRAADWMSVIPKSVEKIEGEKIEGAPMTGRICDLSTKPNGPQVDETILSYDEKTHDMKVRVVPVGGKVPVVQNEIVFSARDLGDGKTRVIWDSNIELKPIGKILYPVLKAGLNKGFNDQLEELKFFVENGQPHPRKVAKAA